MMLQNDGSISFIVRESFFSLFKVTLFLKAPCEQEENNKL